MSKESLAKVVQRAISDAGFRRQLNTDPAGALRGFDLSADELSALRTGDAGRLSSLGVDQRMSKSYSLGGALAATRMAQSDLTSSSNAMIDDGSGAGGRSGVIPHDPEAISTARDDGGASSKSSAIIHDDPDGFLAANADASGASGANAVRIGDDWKFTDRAAAQGSVAPVEGSPEATAAELGRGGGMAAYPAHDGLAGPSAAGSVRAGDDWARSAQIDDSARAGTARLDDASGASSGASVRINDDPDGFLAANAIADASGGSTSEGTAFVDESEAYLTKIGYDPKSEVTDAHDRSWSGDDNAGPTSDSADDNTPDASDGNTLTP